MTVAVLLVNLGTPEAPTPEALRRYLAEFLSDRRVVDLPRLLWWPVLHGIILNTRPAKSAEKYAKVWTPEGSPLKVHTERQAKLLQDLLHKQGHESVAVAWAMRYGQPSIASVLDRLADEGVSRVVVLPLYPQYARSTTASVYDAVEAWHKRRPDGPRIARIRDYHSHPAYVAALVASVCAHWKDHGRPDRLVMSFHGIPRKSIDHGDPYADQCRGTAALLASELALATEEWTITFQSRFGPAEWLQPYTQPTLENLAREGVGTVDVICPGFASDCLETLEEIAIECREAFLAAGGRAFRYIPCLNEQPEGIAAFAEIVLEQIGSE